MAAALKLGGAVLSAIHQRGLENGVVDSGNATTHGGMARAGRCTRLSGCSGRVWPDDGPSPIITDTSGTCRVQLARAALLQKEKARENCGWRTTRPTVGSSLVRTPGVTVVHTGSNRKGTAHTESPVA